APSAPSWTGTLDLVPMPVGVLGFGEHALDDLLDPRQFLERFLDRRAALLEQVALVMHLVEGAAQMVVAAVAQVVGVEILLDFAQGEPDLLAVEDDAQPAPVAVGVEPLVADPARPQHALVLVEAQR